MKKGIFIFLVALLSFPLYSQHVALKNNLVYDATLTPNLSLEIALAKKITLDLGGEFNVANLDLPFDFMQQLRDHRYEGYFYGGGISIGHQWVLAKHWNLEASIGGGYARVEYDKYECKECAPKLKSDHYNYFGVTRATLSIVYIFR